jgi:hypothetical protein
MFRQGNGGARGRRSAGRGHLWPRAYIRLRFAGLLRADNDQVELAPAKKSARERWSLQQQKCLQQGSCLPLFLVMHMPSA